MAKLRKYVVNVPRSSYVEGFENGEFRSMGEPFPYTDGNGNQLVSTKMKVLYDDKDEVIEVSVGRKVLPDEIKRGDKIEFIGLTIAITAEARNGYMGQQANGSLEVAYKAEDFIVVKDEAPVEAKAEAEANKSVLNQKETPKEAHKK